MSLIVQMSQDLDAQRDLARGEVESADLQDVANTKKQPIHSELPLFAAADQLKKQEQMSRYKFIAALVICSVALVTVYLLMYDRGQVSLPSLENMRGALSIAQKSDQASEATGVQVAAVELHKPASINVQASHLTELKINLEAVQSKPPIDNAKPMHLIASLPENSLEIKPVEKSNEAQNKVVAINDTPIVEVVTAQEVAASVALTQNKNSSKQKGKVEEAVVSAEAPDKKASVVKQVAEPSVQRIDAKTVAAARRALQQETVQVVINSLKKTLEQQPGLIESSKLYVSLLISSGQYAQAEKRVTNYRIAYKNVVAFTALYGRLLMATENYTQVLALIDQQKALGNMSYELLSLQAAAYQSLQKWGLALESYSELIRYDATQPRWWLGLAIAHDALGNKGEAKQAYQRVVLGGGLEMALQNYAKSRLAQL